MMVGKIDAERRNWQRPAAVGGLSDDEQVRTHLLVVAAAFGRRSVGEVSSFLSAADSATRSAMTRHLQRACGNGAVRRVMATAGLKAVQRDDKSGTRTAPSTPTTGDIATVTGYLGR